MNLSNLIHLTNLELGLIIVIFFLLLTLIQLNRVMVQSVKEGSQSIHFDKLKEWVEESEGLCEHLSKNLQEKKRITKRLIEQLDGKIQNLNQLLDKSNKKESAHSKDGKAKSLYPQILEMANAGCDVSQISRWLSLSQGEVQLILNLKNMADSEGQAGETVNPSPEQAPQAQMVPTVREDSSKSSPPDGQPAGRKRGDKGEGKRSLSSAPGRASSSEGGRNKLEVRNSQ